MRDEGVASARHLQMFGDTFACITERYSTNLNCVGPAGGLWTSYLGQKRGQYLSATVVLSGGHPSDTGWWSWSSSPHRFPALVFTSSPSTAATTTS